MFTHIDEKNNPTMVDVSEKNITQRTARAQCLIELPSEVMEKFKNGDIQSKKGPVFQTAIIAGTMAVKKTSELIPFCHQLNIESCKIEIKATKDNCLLIDCKVKITGKTGVEMEALTGATITALTVYDMCKAYSHNMIVREVCLIEKEGGKRTVKEKELC
jgi:cyclic pyranopterin monophosphate synthase